jgi:hypothetical protein
MVLTQHLGPPLHRKGASVRFEIAEIGNRNIYPVWHDVNN